MNQKTISEIFATLAARAVFVCPILLLFASKTVSFVQKWPFF
jgi:hypothetical protein